MPKPLELSNLNNDLEFVEKQLAAHTDPYDTIRLMWERRRDALREQISVIEVRQDNYAQVALLFNGAPVVGSQEIKLDFAAKILENYQSVVGSLAAERAGAELGARGRLPAAFTSKLFIRDMVRGSVGFVIEEARPAQYDLVPSALKDAIDEATKILTDLSSIDGRKFDERMGKLSPRTIGAIKRMARILHDSGAETKIIDDEQELNLDYGSTASLNARLSEVEYAERPEIREGVLLGLFPERRQYEFQPSDGAPVSYGPVSEVFDSRYVTEPDFARSIILKPVAAKFLVTTILRAGIPHKEEWVLEDVQLLPKLKAQPL
jgi:hypothetical protein